jgi:hypothetical protein
MKQASRQFLILAILLIPARALATACGCVPVSVSAGEQFRSHTPGTLRAGYAFAYSDTDHYYIGEDRDDATETNVAPATLGIENILNLEYDLPRGVALVGEIPFIKTEQSREFGGVAGTMKASGLGDVRLLARYWLGREASGLRWYSAPGLRLPTGESDGTFVAKDGETVMKDLAAQAGTGNTAGIFELGGTAPLGRRLALGFSGRYVFTPKATTIANFRHELTGTGPEKNSDSDAAAARLSVSAPLGGPGSALHPLAVRALADLAWVPYDDLFGKTEGFRRAGPIVLVGPGLSWAPRQAFHLSAAVPFTIYRDIQQNGGNVQEWMLQFSLSYDLIPGRGI